MHCTARQTYDTVENFRISYHYYYCCFYGQWLMNPWIKNDECYDPFLIVAYIVFIVNCNDFDVSNEVFHKGTEGVLLNEIYRIQCTADISRMFLLFFLYFVFEFWMTQNDLDRSGPDLMITTVACWMVNG